MGNPILLFFVGAGLLFLGVVYLGGDISMMNWRNRCNVAPEDEAPFGRLMGAGTILCGIGIIAAALFSAYVFSLYFFFGCGAVGLGLMMYACIKYNHGFFSR